MPIQEEEHKCEEFDQDWIFTYGDMVTLLLVFFVLLLTFCKTDIEKFKSVAESFKPTPPGSPFFLEGQPSVLEQLAAQVETVELPEDLFVTLDDRGVVVSFKDSALFAPASADLLPKAIGSLSRFVKFLYALPNKIVVEGHTDDQAIRSAKYPSNWELSSARASAVARFLQGEGVKGERMTVLGFAEYRPRFRNDSPAKRALNRRIDVIIAPQ
ncbi:MAG: flagellar motor protein MotB [SAR324 cluster bacterium]|nr:flagellar motor protein MotB [SAR324 cluster bacterium]MCZ6532115.1 flagellar motor protein MotB [SAR324 cluster bacterium]MCZ6557600.1 flagellar motor protein MotB [SAR324 cluster bacterium]MCZ6628830.1 flagellar motor protein MotB [SAR324 cluster bacterium]MCZ6729062.1 flagellar motor protein MotB [SAR324 cluster bacterium]